MKTTGELQQRSRNVSRKINPLVLLLSVLMFAATTYIRPELWNNYFHHVWGFIFPLMGLIGLAGMFSFRSKDSDGKAFISSAVFILGMMSGTAFGLYPTLLHSSIDPAYSLTINNSSAGSYGLQVGLIWWIIGMILALGYFGYLFYTFRGKVIITEDSEGY